MDYVVEDLIEERKVIVGWNYYFGEEREVNLLKFRFINSGDIIVCWLRWEKEKE